ncbi:3-hydroxyisobutyrate dehydrogenase [Oceanospirillum multiglobuliferum]|uniref:Oxidoreductase n=1 Tax=Oceanospirillum multiglobuliferum TaxID=64969 RepID=A0A1T4KD36_9GAMM|nr:NAD(P)-dependent oxidoreductase [Oceanospirillum multiglobuliferum]OPX55999.1 oxidoreductase [Oceanospirillum multiglobuliferum]SJZ40354.1 3-hydroxyisobutyrate dehydrogenase [Oceanospirillum multiglobuliferum]
MTLKLTFIGLGVMGYPMAGHLAKAGHQVTVYNRSTAKAEKWSTEFKGQFALTPALAAQDADIVFCCVGNDDDVRSVTIGDEGVVNTMKAGSILVDHTTASAELALELDTACRNAGLSFIDAPVSGGQQGAENGKLTIMCGGEESTFHIAQPIMSTYAQAVNLMGQAGAGQLTKMVNQICIAGLVQGLSEGLYFAEKAGLDQNKVIDVISKGAAGSWQMLNRHKTMIEDQYNHGFAVDWMRKDLDICLSQGRKIGAKLPITAIIDQFYAEVQAMGGARWDTSSLLKRLKATD